MEVGHIDAMAITNENRHGAARGGKGTVGTQRGGADQAETASRTGHIVEGVQQGARMRFNVLGVNGQT